MIQYSEFFFNKIENIAFVFWAILVPLHARVSNFSTMTVLKKYQNFEHFIINIRRVHMRVVKSP